MAVVLCRWCREAYEPPATHECTIPLMRAVYQYEFTMEFPESMWPNLKAAWYEDSGQYYEDDVFPQEEHELKREVMMWLVQQQEVGNHTDIASESGFEVKEESFSSD